MVYRIDLAILTVRYNWLRLGLLLSLLLVYFFLKLCHSFVHQLTFYVFACFFADIEFALSVCLDLFLGGLFLLSLLLSQFVEEFVSFKS